MEGTKTHEWYQKGTYKPYSTEEAANLIAEVKKIIPPWVRVMRVQRDIPARLIVAGVKKSNLRQLVHEKLASQGERCQCIRCREVGHRNQQGEAPLNPDEIKIKTTRYEASEGQEIFLSAEDPETQHVSWIFASANSLGKSVPTRNPRKHPQPLCGNSTFTDHSCPVGKHSAKAWQHKGFGATHCSAKRNAWHERILG